MSKRRFIFIGLALVLLAYASSAAYRSRMENSEQNIPVAANREQAGERQWETKTDDRPPVTIAITPVELGKGAEMKFRIAFDTHSGILDQDLLRLATLTDEAGNTYAPTGWDGPGPGGHHREGVLTFEAARSIPRSVELNIKDVGGIPKRTFTWEVR